MEARQILATVPFFTETLDDSRLFALASELALKHFPRGAILMREGDLGSSMFAIVSGKVAVSVREPGGDVQVAKLGPGDIVGEMSLLTGARRSATVAAVRAVEAFEIAKPALQSLLADSPDLVRRFATVMEQRQGELRRLHQNAARWNATGLSRAELAARMTAFYAG